MQVVEVCREQFDLVLPSMQIDRRRRNFISSVVTTDLVKFLADRTATQYDRLLA